MDQRPTPSPTTSSALAGPATSGACATATTTSPTSCGGPGRQHRPGPRARQRVVPGPARVGRRSRLLRRRARCPGPARDRVRGRPPPGRSAPTRPGRPGRRTWSRTTSTTARRSTRDCGTTPGCGRASPTEGWSGVHTAADFDPATLTPYVGPPVVRHEEVRPIRIWTSPSGKTLVDFGQNLVGWLRFTVRGERGSTITIRHAEVLEHDELGARPLRTREGDGPVHPLRRRGHLRAHVHLPRLPLCRGRRLAGGADAGLLVAVVVHTDLRRIGRVRVLGRDAQPAAPQRRVGAAGQLARRAHRLPAARRAARLDRRPRRVRAHGRLPLRRRGLPARLARRPRRRAAGRRRPRAVRRPGRPQVHPSAARPAHAGEHGDLGRRRRVGAVGPVGGVRRHRRPAAGVRLDGRARPPGGVAALTDGPVGHGLPVRRLARPDGAARQAGRREGRQGRRRHGLPVPQRPAHAEAARLLGRGRTPSTSTRSPSGPGQCSRSTTCPTTGRCTATRRPSTPSRSSSACSTSPSGRRPATGSPSSSQTAGTASPRDSPARPSSPMP